MLRPSISNDSLLLAVVRSGSDFFDEYLDYFRQIRELRSRRPFYFGLMHSPAKFDAQILAECIAKLPPRNGQMLEKTSTQNRSRSRSQNIAPIDPGNAWFRTPYPKVRRVPWRPQPLIRSASVTGNLWISSCVIKKCK